MVEVTVAHGLYSDYIVQNVRREVSNGGAKEYISTQTTHSGTKAKQLIPDKKLKVMNKQDWKDFQS